MTTHNPYPEEIIDHELERAARKVLMADDRKLLDRYRGALLSEPSVVVSKTNHFLIKPRPKCGFPISDNRTLIRKNKNKQE